MSISSPDCILRFVFLFRMCTIWYVSVSDDMYGTTYLLWILSYVQHMNLVLFLSQTEKLYLENIWTNPQAHDKQKFLEENQRVCGSEAV